MPQSLQETQSKQALWVFTCRVHHSTEQEECMRQALSDVKDFARTHAGLRMEESKVSGCKVVAGGPGL